MLFRGEEWKLNLGVRPPKAGVLYGLRLSRDLDSKRKVDMMVVQWRLGKNS